MDLREEALKLHRENPGKSGWSAKWQSVMPEI